MRTNFFIIFLLLLFIKMNAGIGYWRDCNTFIELKPSSSYSIFVEIKNHEESKLISGQSKRFYTSIEKRSTYENDYVSDIYLSSSNDTVILLPKLTVKFRPTTDVDLVVNEMSNKLKKLEQYKDNVAILECAANTSEEVMNITNRLAHNPAVLWCEPSWLSNISFYNSLYSFQYYNKNTGQFGGTSGMDINVEPAWNITTGKSFVKVAVIDCGVDRQHEDLSNVVSGYTTQNYAGEGAPLTNNWHGTACAGIIGADDNTKGIKGVAPGVSIIPVNIEPVDSFSSNAEIGQAIRWAADRADILSCSWGNNSSTDNPDIVSALQYARSYGRDGKGCIEVFAAGNFWGYDGIQNVSFPARLDSVLAVGALDKNGDICSYSQRGNGLNLMAFGGNSDIVSTDISGSSGYSSSNYVYNFGGTSAACPQVAGVAALMLSANPMLTEAQVREVLQNTAVDMGTTGRDNTYGYGRVNAYAAVNSVKLNVTINGSTIIHGTEVYTLNNLPDGFTVVWTTSNGMPITQVSTDMRQCTLTRTNNTPSQFTLFAEVFYQGVSIKRVYKSIYTQISATYYQESCNYYNVTHPAISTKTLNNNQSTYVHMGCTVHIYSSALPGSTVTHSGVTPETWSYTGGSSITFSLPLWSGGQPFHIYVNGDANSNDGHFLFFAVGNNGNLTSNSLLQVLPAISGFELTVKNNEEVGEWSSNEIVWTLEVYDTKKGKLVHNERVIGCTTTLDTSMWIRGTYVLRVVVAGKEDEPLVEKIQVR